jgi:S1-C subfamily serine protease
LQPVTADIADSMGLDRPAGAVVVSVVDGGPAALAGLKAGDVIMALDNQTVDDADGFGFRFATKPIGTKTELKVNRIGKMVALSIAAMPAPETRPRDIQPLSGRWPLAGATIGNLSPALAEELSVETGDDGVVVASVKSGSAAEELGLKKGDVIISIDSETVKTTQDVLALQRQRKYFWPLVIKRKGELLTSKVGG